MSWVALALSLLQTVLASAQVGQAEQEVIDIIQGAIDKLTGAENAQVTYEELESLRTKPTW